MYEHMTYESVLKRMLDRIPNTFDKREGSVIYDAIAPAAIEVINMYGAVDRVLNESFADTQSRQYLIKRCKERGINVRQATSAIRQGEFNIDVPIGSRFSLNQLNYETIEKISNGVYKLRCEKTGTQGNAESGTLIPIDYIQGLQSAVLTDVLIPGEDEEDTEHLRDRYFESLDSLSFGGNIADYREKTKTFGAGGVKVIPAWNGGGTVKLLILDTTYSQPSSTLVDEIQTKIDPVPGQGVGIAPIGHVVTVEGCGEATVDIKSTIAFKEGYDWESIKSSVETAIDDYFTELSKTWEDTDNIVVKISQIETRLLDVIGVDDITDTTLNGKTNNLTIDSNKIPVRGSVTNVPKTSD